MRRPSSGNNSAKCAGLFQPGDANETGCPAPQACRVTSPAANSTESRSLDQVCASRSQVAWLVPPCRPISWPSCQATRRTGGAAEATQGLSKIAVSELASPSLAAAGMKPLRFLRRCRLSSRRRTSLRNEMTWLKARPGFTKNVKRASHASAKSNRRGIPWRTQVWVSTSNRKQQILAGGFSMMGTHDGRFLHRVRIGLLKTQVTFGVVKNARGRVAVAEDRSRVLPVAPGGPPHADRGG